MCAISYLPILVATIIKLLYQYKADNNRGVECRRVLIEEGVPFPSAQVFSDLLPAHPCVHDTDGYDRVFDRD